jgi:hypothetical protein
LKLASLRPYIALWGLRAAWALAVALWALALVPWFKTPPPPPQQGTAPVAKSRSAVAALRPEQRASEQDVVEPADPTQAVPPSHGASAIEASASRPSGP